MRGWKTWLGAAMMASRSLMEYFGYGELAEVVWNLGMATGVVGIGHKIEKAIR